MSVPSFTNIDPDLISNIVSEIASEKVNLFLGAGLSIGCGLPGWKELTEDLARDAGCGPGCDPLWVAQSYEHRRGRTSLIEKLRLHSDTTDRCPSKVHELLPKLRIARWVTTNYDDLLETTLKQASCPFEVIWRSSQFPACDWRKTAVVKLHGDRNNQDLIIATRDDYFRAQERDTDLWNWLRLELLKKTFLFIGYSLTDPDFGQLRSSVLAKLGRKNIRQSYAIMFDIGENDRHDLNEHHIKVIDLGDSSRDGATESLHNFLANLVEQLNSFPYIKPEYHYGTEAELRVPIDVKKQLADKGCELECCVEYCVYCAYLDAGQFTSIPHNSKPPVPREFDTPEYECIFYCRHDPPHDPEYIWYGWAVGRHRKK